MPNIALSSEEYGTAARSSCSATLDMAEAIRVARAHAPGLTLTQLLIFLTVASEEGLRLNGLGARTNESQATVSRSVSVLTETGHPGSGKTGYGLLTLLRDQDDGRGRRAALSAAGRRLAACMENVFQ